MMNDEKVGFAEIYFCINKKPFRQPERFFIYDYLNGFAYIVAKLQNTNSLARLAVLSILSAACRLLLF